MSNAVQIHQDEVPVTAPISESTALLQIIDRATRDPSFDLDKMERLLAMHERITARNAEASFNAAMGAAQAEMPQVTRDAVNDQTRSRYARLETISKAMNPVITRHGFATSFGTADCPAPGHYRITCEVSHRDGHTRHYHADVPADGTGMKGTANKTATHAFGSTMSYGRRYLKTMIFDVSSTNDDDDGNSAAAGPVEAITDKQVMELRDLIESVGADERKLLAYIKFDRLEDISVDYYPMAVKIVKRKEGQTHGA